jgi:chemotaxis response regulator CheB
MIELPPLPLQFDHIHTLESTGDTEDVPVFTDTQMRAYGEACARAALEAAAVMLDAEHECRKHADNHAAFYARKVRALAKS